MGRERRQVCLEKQWFVWYGCIICVYIGYLFISFVFNAEVKNFSLIYEGVIKFYRWKNLHATF